MFATAITALSTFFHDAAVFAYNNAIPAALILIALFVLNFVRTRMVAARKRRVAKRRAALKAAPATQQKRSFDPYGKIEF